MDNVFDGFMLQEPTQKQPVIVAGKDVKEVDNDYFLIPVKIMDHEGPLRSSFPVENRLLPQGQNILLVSKATANMLRTSHQISMPWQTAQMIYVPML